jgi:hypothetical protein
VDDRDATGADDSRPAFKPPRKAPPPSHRALLDVTNRYAAYHGVAPNRVQRWIAFMALGGALSRMSDSGGSPLFLIKGGVALEMRLRLRARATQDFDTTFRGEREQVLNAIEQAFEEPYVGFTFRIGGEAREMTHMTRLEIKVEYAGRVWSSITMEVSAYEGTDLPAEEVPAISLADFGLHGPERLPCMPLVKQVAQKLHAMTDTLDSGHPNERFRDLWDLWVLREMVPPSLELRAVCEETFNIRARHSWPPEVVAHAHWIEPFAALSAGEGIAVPEARQAAEDVRAYVSAIAEA